MKVEERVVERVVVDKATVYIANDGKEFRTQKECMKYEFEVERIKAYEKIEHMVIEDLACQIPIHTDDSFSDKSYYEWFAVSNEEEHKMLENFFDISIPKTKNYPTIICIETEDEQYSGTPYDYTLDQMFGVTKEFFSKLGYDVNFQRK